MPFSGRLRLVTLLRIDVSRENSAPINILIKIGELGAALAVNSNG
jgi:hypothetical protein